MSAPRWALALLRRVAPAERADDVLGDLEEAHHARVERRGRVIASMLTGLEAVELAAALLRERLRGRGAVAGAEDANLAPSARAQARGRSLRTRASWLDIKLGIRMLVKYPGLTLVGGLALAFAIALGAAYFEVVNDFGNATLPLEDGERVVGLRHRDLTAAAAASPTVHDFATWREGIESVVELGAFRTVERNLITGAGRGEPVAVAEISASAFVLTRIPPVLGRTLVAEDEREGAAPVVVIGEDVWRTRFASDPGVVGREIRLGRTVHTVVGVMPEGYAFPVSHALWIPLRVNPLDYGPGEGPALQVFGRLARGVTLGAAQAELAAIGRRTSAAFPETHERLRPQVVPYTRLFFGGGASQLYMIELVFVLVLVLICANVATLVFARTATREWEIAVRSALGASRGRIVMQLFAEALVLALAATVVGLAAVRWGSQWAMGVLWRALEGQPPFWWDDGLAPATVLYAVALAVLGAVIVSIVPALKATGPGVQARLQRAATGGSGMRLGRLWTGMLVTQVAFAVAILPLGSGFVHTWVQTQRSGLGFPAEEYLSVRLEMDREPASGAAATERNALARFQSTLLELKRRAAEEPGVTGVTLADRFPGMNHRRQHVEVEDAASRADGRGTSERVFGARREISLGERDAPTGAHEVQTAAVDIDFFDVLGAPILSGRGFGAVDLGSDARVVVVNESFVREILRGRSAVGRRVRYARRSDDEEQGPWYEIVGVVKNLAMDRDGLNPGMPAGMYHPLPAAALTPQCCEAAQVLADGDAYTVRMAVHVRGDPGALAPRLRAVATALEPTLRLYDIQPLDTRVSVTQGVRLVNALIVWAFALMVLIALLISGSGTYALMSFTVSRRAREIAIRAALGAGPRRIVTGILSRALVQIGLGVIVGVLLFSLFAVLVLGEGAAPDDQAGWGWLWQFVTIAGIMTLVGLIACGVPVRRALRIAPTEALKEG